METQAQKLQAQGQVGLPDLQVCMASLQIQIHNLLELVTPALM